jgi:hypothetical protein
MERMLVVIAAFSHREEAGAKFFAGKELPPVRPCVSAGSRRIVR